MTTTNEKCGKQLYSAGGFHTYACGRPVKDEGLCGPHLAGKRRGEAADRKREEAYDAQKAKQAEVMDALAALGIEGYPETGYTGNYTGRAVVTLDELRRIRGV